MSAESLDPERLGAAVARSARSAATSRLAWPLCTLGIAGAGGVAALDVLDRTRIHSLHDAQPIGIVLGVSFSVLGAIIVSRQPDNRIGWIYLLIGVLTPAQSIADLYYMRSVLSGGLPGARWAAWLNTWLTWVVFPAGLSLFAFLLFPSGRLPSPRWRPVAWLAIAISAITILLRLVDPTPISVASDLPNAGNPTGVTAPGSKLGSGSFGTVVYLGGMALLAVTIGSLVVRGRRASRQERQQVKMLAYAAALTTGSVIVLTIVAIAGGPVGNTLWDTPIVVGFGVAVPVACGVAILKHGLYEIDRLISRTFSYAIVTGVLVATFLGLVLLTTHVLPFSSSVGVAASTLASAALFNPLRRRIQRRVDRRFNRAGYDAGRTVASFSNLLRDAVDIDTIRDELIHAVDNAVAPAHVSVWVRPDRTAMHS